MTVGGRTAARSPSSVLPASGIGNLIAAPLQAERITGEGAAVDGAEVRMLRVTVTADEHRERNALLVGISRSAERAHPSVAFGQVRFSTS